MEGIATSPEELMARMASEQGEGATETETQAATETAETVEQEQVDASAEAEEKEEAQSSSTDWLQEFNKAFGTEYKEVDEVKPLLDLPSKVKEYEEKEETYKSFKEQEKSYKSKIEELQSSLNPLKYFSSPDAYIAEQLRVQHPDKNPVLLHELATKDLKSMDDFDVLVKSVLLEQPDLAEKDVRQYLEGELGVDPETPMEELDASVRTKIKIKAAEKRKELGVLKSQIQLPEVLTPEQLEQQKAEQFEKVKETIKPYADKFAQFDKFSTEVGDKKFEFVVPDEYKESLKPMFESFFLSGNELNEQNLQTVSELRDALLLSRHLPSVYRAIESDVEARLRQEMDEKLGNTAPPNTSTASDAATETESPHGMGAFLRGI